MNINEFFILALFFSSEDVAKKTSFNKKTRLNNI